MNRRQLLKKAKEAATGSADPNAPFEDESVAQSIAGTLGDIKERVKEKRKERQRSKQFDQAVRERARSEAEQEFRKERREQIRQQEKQQLKEQLRQRSQLFDTDGDQQADVAVTQLEAPADRFGPSPMLEQQPTQRQPDRGGGSVELGPSPMLDRQPAQAVNRDTGRAGPSETTATQPALPRDIGLAVLDSTAPVGLPEFGNDPVAEEFKRAQQNSRDDPRGWDDLQW